MAIDWNQAEYVSPKIQISPEQLPLEAAIKVGDTLQNRYDQAITQDTKLAALNKKLLSSVDPADQELANQITEFFGNRLKDRSTKGDYHNMRWQTLADAEEFANIYSGLTEKAKTIQKYKDLINTNDKVANPELRKMQIEKWLAGQSKSQFDPEKRTLMGLSVNAPNIVNDFEFDKWADSFATGWKADAGGGKKAETLLTKRGDRLPDGTTSAGGYYKSVTGSKWEKVNPNEVKTALENLAKGDYKLQATIDRDTEYSLYTNPLREGETLESRRAAVEKETLGKAIDFAASKQGYTQSFSESIAEPDAAMNKANSSNITLNGNWAQRPSAIFKVNEAGAYEVNEDGTIKTKKLGPIEFMEKQKSMGETNMDVINELYQKQGEVLSDKDVTYTRLKNLLLKKGVISEKSSKKEVSSAIANHLNNTLKSAESSIVVPMAGDKEANAYMEEVNRSYFGITEPNAKAKGTSILSGLAAMSSFTGENGNPMTAKQVFEQVKDRNVRVTGVVQSINSPFEYGSHYMVATDNNGENKHYLISPDLETKNTGMYFANRIKSSENNSNVKSKWQDGYGVEYEATPSDKGYIVYVKPPGSKQFDVSKPIILDSEDMYLLETISQPGLVSQYFNERYKQ